MQKLISKLFIILLFSLQTLTLIAQSNERILIKADSLFENRRYTQSFQLYDTLLNKNLFTPAMLLKMSYIAEGLDRNSESLYYLNLYYLTTTDEDALVKMEEMGEELGLTGYSASGSDLLFTYFYRYFNEIIIGLTIICLVLVSVSFYLRYKTNTTPYWSAISFVLASGLIFYLVNYGREYDKAIIKSENAYLMSDASSASSLREVASEGHKVEVLDKKDVWVKIKWQDEEVFIKENHLKPLNIFNN